MKKFLKRFLVVLVILAVLAGGVFLYVTTTPEYALYMTLKDVQESGMDGLKKHLTEDAADTIETVEDWSITELISSLTQDSAYDFLISKMEEVDWTLEDILKGKKETDVVIGFNYSNSITISGTVEITMIKEDHTWKIDSIAFPDFEEISLW